MFGIDKELGFSLSTNKYFDDQTKEHFITKEVNQYDFGESMNNIYALHNEVDILEYSNQEIHLSSNNYGKGRGLYIAELPFNNDNTRLLMRALYYVANKESDFNKWHVTNVNCEVHVYPESGYSAIVNNTYDEQTADFYNGEGNIEKIILEPGEIRWAGIS